VSKEPEPSPRIPILFAGSTFVVGGAERVFAHLIHGLNSSPFAPELLALREPGPIGEELAGAGIPLVSRLTGDGKFDPFVVAKIRRLIRSRRYEAIYFLDHAHTVFYGTLASLGTSVRLRVMPVHTTGQWDGQPSLKRPIRLVQGKLDRIISIAEAQREYLIREEGVSKDQLVVIPNGVPIEAPDAEARKKGRAEVRAELGVADDVPVAGITAVLRPEKNHELLLQSFVRVRAEEPKSEIWILGDGPRREFLEAEVRRLHLEEAVRFLGYRGDARRWMLGFDVAVLTSHPRVETLPLSFIEAMDAGNPVVATRVGALAEMIDEGNSGFLVEPSDVEGLSDALIRVLADLDRAQAMGEAAQAIAGAKYSVDRMVSLTRDLLVDRLRATAQS